MTAPVIKADVGVAGTRPVASLAAGIAAVAVGAWAGPSQGAGSEISSEGAGAGIPIVTCFNGCGDPGSRTGNYRDSGAGGGVIGIGGSDPASSTNGMSVDEEAPFYVLGWTGVATKVLVARTMPPPATANTLGTCSWSPQ